jgi:cleavage stimulation factor subunit 3
MAELFPEDPRLDYFRGRYSSDKFDPISAPIIISKAVQMRPKQVLPTIEKPTSVRNSPRPSRVDQSPRPQYARATASPKRPLGVDEEELNPPKRLARGVSPLKGAAGRRLDQQRRNQASALHRDITFLLTILPPPQTYDGQRLNAAGLTSLLRDTALPPPSEWNAKLGAQGRQNTPGHGRQPSGDVAGRPISPYGRLQSASGGYRNSPLSGAPVNPYAPPPMPSATPSAWPPVAGGYQQPPPGQYGGYQY